MKTTTILMLIVMSMVFNGFVGYTIYKDGQGAVHDHYYGFVEYDFQG